MPTVKWLVNFLTVVNNKVLFVFLLMMLEICFAYYSIVCAKHPFMDFIDLEFVFEPYAFSFPTFFLKEFVRKLVLYVIYVMYIEQSNSIFS